MEKLLKKIESATPAVKGEGKRWGEQPVGRAVKIHTFIN